ncbi:hypothetical protein ACKWTF_004597 [Chironomus riparius]
MDFKRIFIFFCATSAVNCIEKALKPIKNFNETFANSIAISDVIQKFYTEKEQRFDTILSEGYLTKTGRTTDELLSQSRGNFSYNLKVFDTSNSEKFFAVKESTIFFTFECSDLFFINNQFILLSDFSKNLQILIYIEKCTLEILKTHMMLFVKQFELKMYRSLIEVFEFFLINEGNFLHLATIEWFTKVKCNSPQLIVLNTFDKLSGKWNSELQNYDKFQNFHSCRLVMLLPIENIIWGRVEFDKNSQRAIGIGLTPVIFKILSKKFNFRAYYQPATLESDTTFFSKKKHIDNFLIPVDGITHTPNVYFEVIQPVSLYSSFLHMTSTFLEIKELICVTPGDLYTPYEKLLLPFDAITWTLFSITFITAFVTISIINQTPKFLQHIFYGRKIQTPALNVLSIFFGIPQYKLPRTNFARFLLIMFVFFCLIFRTCFQSKMFEFLSSEPRKAPPKTVEDLIERNYSINLIEYFRQLEDIIEDEKDKW